MAKISGANALMRFARTAPQWQNATRRVWNPASISWRDSATTGLHTYLMSSAGVNAVFPNIASGYAYCISMWVKPRTIAGSKGIMQLENAAGVPQVSLTMNGTGIGVMWNNDPATVIASSGLISLNIWNHILFQQADNAWTIKVNGTEDTGTLTTIPDFSLITQWRLGRGTDAAGAEQFDGLMSDIMVAQDYPNYTQRFVLYNDGAAFNMAQTVVAPINPLNASMTFYCDGTNTGTPMSLGTSRMTSPAISPSIVQYFWNWDGSLQTVPQLDADSRPAAKGTTYTRLAESAQGWDNANHVGTTQGTNPLPVPAAENIQDYYPALGAWPFSGWGVLTDSSSYVGVINAPKATPRLTVSGTLTEQGTSLNPVVGDGTLQWALDAREVRYLRPMFAKKV